MSKILLKQLQKLQVLQFLQNNLGKIFPALRYTSSEEKLLEEIRNALAGDFGKIEDLSWVLKLSLRDLSKFTEKEVCGKISEIEGKLKKEKKVSRKGNLLG